MLLRVLRLQVRLHMHQVAHVRSRARAEMPPRGSHTAAATVSVHYFPSLSTRLRRHEILSLYAHVLEPKRESMAAVTFTLLRFIFISA